MAEDRPRAVNLIDGQWLEAARNGKVDDAHWDLHDFAERIVPKYHWRFRTYYFDALPFKDRTNPTATQKKQYQDKEKEILSIEQKERFTVRQGYCKKATVGGYLKGAGAQTKKTRVITIQQKMVDVLLAVDLTRIAWSKEALHISLVAGDGDFIAAVDAAKGAGAIVRLYHIKTRYTGVAPRLFNEVDERVDLTQIFKDMQSGKKRKKK